MANIEIQLIEKLTDVLAFAQGCDIEVLADIERWFMSQYRAAHRRVQNEKAAVCRCAAEMADLFVKNKESRSKFNKEQIYEILYESSVEATNDIYVQGGLEKANTNLGNSMAQVF